MSRPNTIQELLSAYKPLQLSAAGARRAAVLIALRPQRELRGGLELVFTRRASGLVSHAGQVSFPGGHIEAVDASPEAAAIRETGEELGIPATSIRLCGRLDEIFTITGYHIVPVVGLLDESSAFHPDPREVARAFTVPLAALMRPEAWQQRIHHYRDSTFRVWHFPYDGEDIWGATASMLRSFIELLWSAKEAA